MASRQGGYGVTSRVEVLGAKDLSLFLKDQIIDGALNVANRDLRQGTKEIANEILIPAIKSAAAVSGVPQAEKMAETAFTRSDRIVFVSIGRKNPKLSGYKRGTPQRVRTSLAWGSDLGPYPGSKKNVYQVPRNENGYWARKTATDPAVFAKVTQAYSDLMFKILNKYGRYS